VGAATGLLASLTGAEPAVGAESGEISVQVGGGGALPGIIRAFEDRSIELAEFALRRASLDEVFLALTGHRPEQDAAAEAGAGTGTGANTDRQLDRSTR